MLSVCSLSGLLDLNTLIGSILGGAGLLIPDALSPTLLAAAPAGGGSILHSISEWFSTLNWIDFVLLLGLFSGLFVGIGVGFYRQIALFLSLGIGLFAAARLSPLLAASPKFDPVANALGEDWSQIAAFAVVLWSALVIGVLACLVFHSFFSRSLRVADGALGGVVGVAISGVFLGIVLLIAFHSPSKRFHEPIRTSVLGSHLTESAKYVTEFLPPDIRDRIRPPGSPSPDDGSSDGGRSAPHS